MSNPHDLVYPLGDTHHWVLTFGGHYAQRKAIWKQPNVNAGAHVIIADIERLIAAIKAEPNSPFPVPVASWPASKLERFCDTQLLTFTQPTRYDLEMPEINLKIMEGKSTQYHAVINNGRNRISIAYHLGAQYIPIEVPGKCHDHALRILGCRS